MPFYQIVSVVSSDFNNPAGLYNMLSKKVSTLLLEGWKCQGGVAILAFEGQTYEIIQAMTLD